MKKYHLILTRDNKGKMLPCAYAECIDHALDYTRRNSGVFKIVKLDAIQLFNVMENYCIQFIGGKEEVE